MEKDMEIWLKQREKTCKKREKYMRKRKEAIAVGKVTKSEKSCDLQGSPKNINETNRTVLAVNFC
jgi:hypothetical protein